MKKIALLLLMFVAFQVSAQDFHFLPKIGLNLANMTNSDGSMKSGLPPSFLSIRNFPSSRESIIPCKE